MEAGKGSHGYRKRTAEKTCGREGCGQKMYEVIPATGQSPDEDGTGQGDLRVDLEITQDAPIASGGIYNTKKELLDAPGNL